MGKAHGCLVERREADGRPRARDCARSTAVRKFCRAARATGSARLPRSKSCRDRGCPGPRKRQPAVARAVCLRCLTIGMSKFRRGVAFAERQDTAITDHDATHAFADRVVGKQLGGQFRADAARITHGQRNRRQAFVPSRHRPASPNIAICGLDRPTAFCIQYVEYSRCRVKLNLADRCNTMPSGLCSVMVCTHHRRSRALPNRIRQWPNRIS